MGLFGKSQQKDPKEQIREWNSKLRKEQFQLDRQIRAIKREEDKVAKSLKDAAKKNDKEVCILLAKQIVTSRKAINRIHTSKAQINSIMMGMNHQVSTLKLAGSLQKSTEVMKSMQNLVKVPEVAHTMQELSKEMMKAGIIEEMMEDTLEGLDNSEDIEEEAQEEVDKVLWELTAGTLGKAPVAVSGDVLPAGAGAEASASSAEAALAESDDEEVEAMKERLEALRS